MVRLKKSRKVDIFGLKVNAPDTVPEDIPTLFKTFRQAEGSPKKELKRIRKFRKRFEEIEEFQEMQEGLQRSGRFSFSG